MQYSIVAAHIVSEDLGKAMVHMNTTPRKTASDMHVAKRISLTGAVHWNFFDTAPYVLIESVLFSGNSMVISIIADVSQSFPFNLQHFLNVLLQL